MKYKVGDLIANTDCVFKIVGVGPNYYETLFVALCYSSSSPVYTLIHQIFKQNKKEIESLYTLFEGVDGRHLIHNIQDLKSAYLDPKDIKDPLDEPLYYHTYINGVRIDTQTVNQHTVEEIDDNALLELNKTLPVEVCYDREKPSADYSDAFDVLKSMLGG